MALATITGNRSDIAGLPDRGDLWFKPTTPTEDALSPRRVKAVIGTDGNFTIQLQPGTHTVTIFNNDVTFSVPADAGTHTLWSLIAAAVNLPPTTSQAKLDAAVARLVESGSTAILTQTEADTAFAPIDDPRFDEMGGASDADVAAIVTDPTSQTKTSLDATYAPQDAYVIFRDTAGNLLPPGSITEIRIDTVTGDIDDIIYVPSEG